MLGGGILLLLAGPLYGWLAVNYSGELALAQKISAADAVRGFSFGPVYLQSGQTCRYFISAALPPTDEGYWHTSFEVLNEQLDPVFRQDELRFIGDFKLKAGKRDRYHKAFCLTKDTGSFWFRFTAHNGHFPENLNVSPVVEFAVRQNVISGWSLWLPVAGMLLLGAVLVLRALIYINRLGASTRVDAASDQGTVRRPQAGAPVRVQRPHPVR